MEGKRAEGDAETDSNSEAVSDIGANFESGPHADSRTNSDFRADSRATIRNRFQKTSELAGIDSEDHFSQHYFRIHRMSTYTEN